MLYLLIRSENISKNALFKKSHHFFLQNRIILPKITFHYRKISKYWAVDTGQYEIGLKHTKMQEAKGEILVYTTFITNYFKIAWIKLC